jgi:hypothetical protein
VYRIAGLWYQGLRKMRQGHCTDRGHKAAGECQLDDLFPRSQPAAIRHSGPASRVTTGCPRRCPRAVFRPVCGRRQWSPPSHRVSNVAVISISPEKAGSAESKVVASTISCRRIEFDEPCREAVVPHGGFAAARLLGCADRRATFDNLRRPGRRNGGSSRSSLPETGSQRPRDP